LNLGDYRVTPFYFEKRVSLHIKLFHLTIS
jgi:hypothetical protein